ncbi:MAG: methyltransferase [Pseudomonadota bacterium]
MGDLGYAARRIALVFGFAALAACGGAGEEQAAAQKTAPSSGEILDAVVAGAWREEDAARDVYRNPKDTLQFFGLAPDMTVIEIWPGGGWYTKVIAPYIAQGGGVYTAAVPTLAPDPGWRAERLKQFKAAYVGNPDLFGEVRLAEFGKTSPAVAPEGSADMILTFRNVHNWMAGGFAEKAFTDFYAALKPGGVLGVVDHRLPADTEQDPNAASGYVREDVVVAMAEAAGFELADRSDVNANPKDDADHPFGVWTLPPRLRASNYGEDATPEFDHAPYKAIGESDRFTLKFVKPEFGADGALLE